MAACQTVVDCAGFKVHLLWDRGMDSKGVKKPRGAAWTAERDNEVNQSLIDLQQEFSEAKSKYK